MIQNRSVRNIIVAVISNCSLWLAIDAHIIAYAQGTLGARSIALGQATSALPANPWAGFDNPALVESEKPQLSFFGIRYYGLAELTDIAAVASVPTGAGVMGGGVHRFGNDVYNESRIRLIYKNEFDRFHYGAALNYTHVMMGGGYGSAGALGIDIGIAAMITDGLWIGAKAMNVNQPSYGTYGEMTEQPARNLSVGMAYCLNHSAIITADVIKDVEFPISYRAGTEVTVIGNLQARAGITTSPQTFAGGFGYRSDRFGVNLVVQRHEVKSLGYSPGVDFSVRW